jgi:hypothetical protein
MAIFDIRLPNNKYIETVRGLYKYTVILIIFQILVSLSRRGKTLNFGFSGDILNENFLNTLCLLLISYLAYTLIFQELLIIN